MPLPNARVAIRAVLAVAGAPVLVRAGAAGAAALAALRDRRWLAAVGGGVALVALDPPAPFRAATGLALAIGSVLAAWRLAPEQPSFALRLLRPTRPSLALYGTHVLRLARTARARLVIAAMAVAGGGAALATIGADHVAPTPRALVSLTLPLVLAAGLVAPAVLESERGVRVLLRSLRVRRGVVLGAFFAAVATPGTALASGAVLVARTATDGIPLALAGPVAALSLAVAGLVGTWGRIAGRRSGAFVGGVAVLAAGLFVVVARW